MKSGRTAPLNMNFCITLKSILFNKNMVILSQGANYFLHELELGRIIVKLSPQIRTTLID